LSPPSHLFAPLPDQQVFIQAARSNNFDIRARSAELAQQGFRVELAKNERYPTISVGPSYSEERAGERERVLAVGVSIPVPLWNRNSGNIAAAAARRLQAETSLLTTARDVERKTVEALLSYQTKVQEMTKWRPDAVDHFREAAELADRHYRLGAVPISTYVELQEQYLDAVEGLLETRREALEAASDLEVLTGLPLPLARNTPTPTGDQK
jgi:cobalt-zinc-cadmium efflux system outer membrane protein